MCPGVTINEVATDLIKPIFTVRVNAHETTLIELLHFLKKYASIYMKSLKGSLLAIMIQMLLLIIQPTFLLLVKHSETTCYL